MGVIKPFHLCKLFTGILYTDQSLYEKTERELVKLFGDIDLSSEPFPFTMTSYYTEEMGTDLTKRFISFGKLVNPQNISHIKISTNKIEDLFAGLRGRKVNIDPGLVDAAKVMLATTKDFAHRLPLMDGIFGEVTLSFKGKSFVSGPWTYPDYGRPEAIEYFNKLKQIFMEQNSQSA